MNEHGLRSEIAANNDEALPDPMPAASAVALVAEEVTDGVLVFCEAFLLLQKLLFSNVDLRNYRLTRSQLYVMLCLLRHERMTMSQVAAGLAVSKEQATRTVASLVELGYVERLEDQHNRKLVLVQLTTAGRDFLDLEKKKMKQNLAQCFHTLDQQQMNEFNSSVRTVIHYLGMLGRA